MTAALKLEFCILYISTANDPHSVPRACVQSATVLYTTSPTATKIIIAAIISFAELVTADAVIVPPPPSYITPLWLWFSRVSAVRDGIVKYRNIIVTFKKYGQFLE